MLQRSCYLLKSRDCLHLRYRNFVTWQSLEVTEVKNNYLAETWWGRLGVLALLSQRVEDLTFAKNDEKKIVF